MPTACHYSSKEMYVNCDSADWSQSGAEQAAAYTRAGLPQWAAQCLSEPGSPTGPASRSPISAARQRPFQQDLADQPSAVVQATVSNVMLTLPHDQDFGRAERYVELWAKAFEQVVTYLTPHRRDIPPTVPAKHDSKSCALSFGYRMRLCLISACCSSHGLPSMHTQE